MSYSNKIRKKNSKIEKKGITWYHTCVWFEKKREKLKKNKNEKKRMWKKEKIRERESGDRGEYASLQ